MSLSSFHQYSLDWQHLLPTLTFSPQLTQAVDYMDLQPRASSCLQYFLHNPTAKLLLLKSHNIAETSQFIQQYIQKHSALFSNEDIQTNQVKGVKYQIEQGDAFTFPYIYITPAQQKEDNFASQYDVATALYFDHSTLFGCLRQHPQSKDIQLEAGLVHKVNQGILILSLAHLLNHFDLWLQLKNILLTERFEWHSLDPFKSLPCKIPGYELKIKVILLGNPDELATFSELEKELVHQANYGEINHYFHLETLEQQQQWVDFVRTFAQQQELPNLDQSAINKLYQLLVRESEDRYLVSSSPAKLQNLLKLASIYTDQQISAVHLEQVFQQQQYQQGFLPEQTYADILHEQVYIATDGEMIGQVNGLSVIEYQGTPIIFGEPARISCIVNFGEGEIIDIDRKNELAGNIHGKGMMIAEACLMGLMNFQSQLPFSASLVFEQSYSDIDGDSASLAIFCVLLSALTDLPIPQSIAITGAIDQFGFVHTVGGINHKIEGFFTICEQRGLNGQQGVIIPAVACQQLSLSEKVVSAVKNKQFFIWTVEDVHQAIEILFKRDLIEDKQKTYKQEELPLSYLIEQRIEQKTETNSKKHWLNWFSKYNR